MKGKVKIDPGHVVKMNVMSQSNVEASSGLPFSEKLPDKNMTNSKTESEILGLPYSWTVNNIELTLLGLAKVEGYERTNPLDNKKQYEVIIKFKNLLKTSNKIPGGSLGFDSLNLKTDVGNIWDIKYNAGNLTLTETLDPEEEFIRNESAFEIRKTEIPEHLLAEIFGKKYVFAVKLITDERNVASNKNYQFM
ncbi:MAG TPA: hypothetical protein VLD38_08695 [Nitrosopumilaceae archaeon]|nr:hypothetical protein [Nitrosopumilaceae archaeon]